MEEPAPRTKRALWTTGLPGRQRTTGRMATVARTVRGPAVVGMRLGFRRIVSLNARGWMVTSTKAHDYRSTHDNMEPYYREIWAGVYGEVPCYAEPTLPRRLRHGRSI
ncbi:hypothetical protein BDZ89DRAFT_1053721 [Hymenopellis radicata]|nr:hypothetical protein BDZ89DRAFT_1053721 [Hymenopellis radicata]